MATAAQEQDVEFEEGECSDSDTDVVPPLVSRNSVSDASYRSRIPQIVINSDENDSDSDEDCPIKRSKQIRANLMHQQNGPSLSQNTNSFVNPIASGNLGLPKKRNNIWGSVLTEQCLSQDIKSFGVDKIEAKMLSRDVESYDYTKAKDDDRPSIEEYGETADPSKEDIFNDVVDLEAEVVKHDRRQRKRKAKDRLGKRWYDKNKIEDLGVTEDSPVEEVVRAITDALHEQNVDLFTKMVGTVGAATALRLYHMAREVERAGGMLINSGSRRRSPGGTYIQLLKTDPMISEETKESIFAEGQQQWKEQQKQKRKMAKAARRHKKKQHERVEPEKDDFDLNLPESPSPIDELGGELGEVQDLDSLDHHLSRPATPEPKDDSSDGDEGEEDDDDEDISVAIAKAKAAILKKQREMAGQSGDAQMEGGDAAAKEPVLDLHDGTDAMEEL